MTDQPPINRLVAGVRAFQENVFPEQREHLQSLARDGQNPGTLFIACADSRFSPELITQAAPGELFVCRNVGNLVPAYGEMLGGVSAVVEYACEALEVTDIVVCGHTDCGAMKGLMAGGGKAMQSMPTVASWLRNAHAALSIVQATQPDADDATRLRAVVKQNVLIQLQHLRTHPAVAARLATNRVTLHGWVYDIEAGEVDVLDSAGRATPIEQSLPQP